MNFRFEKILKHKIFAETIKQIEKAEENRRFCRHGMEHIISVARIAYIISLENNSGISKDIIYAAALLHDIGRKKEYECGISHNEAGAEIAREILYDCGYSDEETALITNAVLTHRHDECENVASSLEKFICLADKFSRTCFDCQAYNECNWGKEKKNETLIY